MGIEEEIDPWSQSPKPSVTTATTVQTGTDIAGSGIRKEGNFDLDLDLQPKPTVAPTELERELEEEKAALAATTLSGITNHEYGDAEGGVGKEEDVEKKKQEVLNEFDPLVDQEEKAAREAWESSESHPPLPTKDDKEKQVGNEDPHATPTKRSSTSNTTSTPTALTQTQTQPQPQPQQAVPQRSSSPIPSFPSLAALARTFALPLVGGSGVNASGGAAGGRFRPRSLDTATSVPSPATLSSFAAQQSAPPKSSTSSDRERERDGGASGSGRSTPVKGGSSKTVKEGEALPFDFQRFLDQMKQKNAEPVAKYLRSFLSNFAKRTFTVGDQVKLINDFLNFISQRMRECEVWKNASEAEFDNAMEGMEKLVMNRLYDFTFTPQLVRMVPPRPVTTDDLERDRVLSQRIALFGWVEPKHLDVPEGEGSEGFLMFAQQELLKINHYKAPRDKLICILNCCKVIFGLIRHLRKEEGADTFLPILIYVVLKANPEHLLSNVEFINRFRNPAKLQSEAGYYLSSLMGAVSFIETMDHTSLSNITQEEFERNVENAIASLPSTGSQTPSSSGRPSPSPSPSPSPHIAAPAPSSLTGEESAQPLALPTPAQTIGEDAKRFLQKTGDTISKPLSAIGRIFNEVLDNAEESLASLPGPFAPFGENDDAARRTGTLSPGAAPHTPMSAGYSEERYSQQQTPYKPRIRRSPQSSAHSSRYGSPTPEDYTPSRPPPHGGSISGRGPYTNQPLAMGPSQPIPQQSPSYLQAPHLQSVFQSDPTHLQQQQQAGLGVSRTPTPNLDFSGLQAEIDRAHEHAASAAKETLRQIFPTTDQEVIEWVLEANEGDLGKSIEALLEMSSGT
ncbi:hypothetical protein K474DRAFT_1651205 [Panus rudis PR-1116 ss-1]|nr:hypothetical protein K474DRAFT_1651205 [Panus rudis PR-1116 ss-1]